MPANLKFCHLSRRITWRYTRHIFQQLHIDAWRRIMSSITLDTIILGKKEKLLYMRLTSTVTRFKHYWEHLVTTKEKLKSCGKLQRKSGIKLRIIRSEICMPLYRDNWTPSLKLKEAIVSTDMDFYAWTIFLCKNI